MKTKLVRSATEHLSKGITGKFRFIYEVEGSLKINGFNKRVNFFPKTIYPDSTVKINEKIPVFANNNGSPLHLFYWDSIKDGFRSFNNCPGCLPYFINARCSWDIDHKTLRSNNGFSPIDLLHFLKTKDGKIN